jgi:hypothetical protein
MLQKIEYVLLIQEKSTVVVGATTTKTINHLTSLLHLLSKCFRRRQDSSCLVSQWLQFQAWTSSHHSLLLNQVNQAWMSRRWWLNLNLAYQLL